MQYAACGRVTSSYYLSQVDKPDTSGSERERECELECELDEWVQDS